MINRHEIDNLEIMLQTGLISEKAFQCHKKALLQKHKKLQNINLCLIDLNKFSILKSLKFSFSPLSFLSTFFFLLIASTILVALFRIVWGEQESFDQLLYFVQNQKEKHGISFYLTTSFLYALWQTTWFCFFSYLSFASLKQMYGAFSYKQFFKKSFLLLLIITGWFVTLLALWISFVIHILNQYPGISDISNLNFKQIILLIIYLLSAGIVSYLFTNLTMSFVGPLKTRLFQKAFWKGLKNPTYTIKFWLGVIINMIVVGIIFYCTKIYILPAIKTIYISILEVSTISSMASLLIFLTMYTLIYSAVPKKRKFWIYFSFLFFIPSAIVYSMLTGSISVQATMLFFILMHIIWLYFYVVIFFTVQNISFWNHSLTQIWCCLMNGEYVTLENPKKQN